ncbi:glycosyltransferase family 2 protein [Asticcacaulis excentricus]|uniref:glycosyltransferase family 2 protein n=1 Tax=Asticcacaulis excentricus TaxID=78587 RepID=UPI000F827CB0|nr:glycosyltransferase family 2 protein [Asticcacaulis excentricus]
MRLFKRSTLSAKSAVCLIAKNEGPYLLEWIAYHRVLGFDQIIVYNNNSTDQSAEVLEKLAAAGIITYRFWPHGAHGSPQIAAYMDALKRSEAEWMLFIDADEFLVLHQHPNVNAFLASFEVNGNIDAICFNWRIFGDSHMPRSDGRPVIERFTWAAPEDFGVNAHLKSFIKTARQRGVVHMHLCDVIGDKVYSSGRALEMEQWGVSKDIDTTVAQVNHYYTKTLEEYQIKKARGQAGCGENEHDLKYNWYHDEAFHGHNRNDEQELSIQKYVAAVKEEMLKLSAVFA